MREVYIHIGYPKCLSTSIQRSFFEKHPQIFYAGIGVCDSLSYINDTIEQLFESGLKYENAISWEKNSKIYKSELDELFELANNKKLVFSSEHLAFNFSLQGIDSELKYGRLAKLFSGCEINLLLVKRNPISLIRSLYKEYLKLGYDMEYKELLKWLITFKDRNFLYDLNTDAKVGQLNKYFTSANITVLDFNFLVENIEININNKISEWLGVDNLSLAFKNDNASMSKEQAYAVMAFNKLVNYGLSGNQYTPFEKHRNRKIYHLSGFSYKEEIIFSDVLKKRDAMKYKVDTRSKKLFDKEIQKLEQRIVDEIEH